jgi:hypothetical protein
MISLVQITMDGGGSNGRQWRNGRLDGSANGSVSAMEGGSSYA